MTLPDRITFRLGPLTQPLRFAATASGRTVSAEARHRLAESLGVAAPDMPMGFAAMDKRKAARARKKAARTLRANWIKRKLNFD
jgi:hypothetical protein